MTGRKTEDYIQVLRKVANILNMQPNTIISDFEKAEQNALKIIFPQAEVIGCFFHYSKVIKNNIKRIRK